jgi:hypothetical protein
MIEPEAPKVNLMQPGALPPFLSMCNVPVKSRSPRVVHTVGDMLGTGVGFLIGAGVSFLVGESLDSGAGPLVGDSLGCEVGPLVG